MAETVLRIRPGNPYNGKRLHEEDLFTIPKGSTVLFEDGMSVDAISNSGTIILNTKEFCAVVRKEKTFNNKRYIQVVGICKPLNVSGREVLYSSPTVNSLLQRSISARGVTMKVTNFLEQWSKAMSMQADLENALFLEVKAKCPNTEILRVYDSITFIPGIGEKAILVGIISGFEHKEKVKWQS